MSLFSSIVSQAEKDAVEKVTPGLAANKSLTERLVGWVSKELNSAGSVGRDLVAGAEVRGAAESTAMSASGDDLKNAGELLTEHIKGLQGQIDAINGLSTKSEAQMQQAQMYQHQIDALNTKRDNIIGLANSGGSMSYQEAPGLWSKAKNLGGQISDYYTNGTGQQMATRAGVTAGAYAGGAIGLRYLSGGTLTTNNQGESDIAGIPFI